MPARTRTYRSINGLHRKRIEFLRNAAWTREFECHKVCQQSERSRNDKMAIELFLAGVWAWEVW